jgi:AraC-like DNA-binding protein
LSNGASDLPSRAKCLTADGTQLEFCPHEQFGGLDLPGLAKDQTAAHRSVVRSLAAWRDAIQQLFPGFDPQPNGDDVFVGDYSRRSVGQLGLTEMGAGRYVMTHRRLDQRAATKPGCCLIIQIEGQALMSQAGRQALLSPGDLTLIDGTRAADFVYHQRYRQLAVQLPHRAVTRRFGSDIPTARLLPGANTVPSMVREMTLALYRGADTLPGQQGRPLADTLIDLLGMALDQSETTVNAIQGDRLDDQIAAIKLFVQNNLSDPLLDPSAIAVAHNMSLRQLHRLFSQTQSSVGEWILRCRLERCYADLADPRLKHRPIGDIALNWGFNSFSHFSRTFKDCYGLTPRDYRTSVVAT